MRFGNISLWNIWNSQETDAVVISNEYRHGEGLDDAVSLTKADVWYAFHLEGLRANTDYFLKFWYLAPELPKGSTSVWNSAGVFNAALQHADYTTTGDINNIGYLHVLTPSGNMNSKNGLGTTQHRKKGRFRDTKGAVAGVWKEMKLHFHSGDMPHAMQLVLNPKSPRVYLDELSVIAVPLKEQTATVAPIPLLAQATCLGTFDTRSSETTVYGECDKALFHHYCDLLQEDGYCIFQEQQLEDNCFSFFTKEETVVGVSYYPANQTLRVFRQIRDHLPQDIPAITDGEHAPLLVQVNHLNGTGGGIGESYIMQLSDGSFLLVDGGYSEYEYSQVDILYQSLRKYQPDGKLRIAGWLITHAHGDHMGCFITMLERYSDELEIEQLIYHFPTDEDIAGSNSARYTFYGYNSVSLLEMNMRHYMPNLTVSTPHTGYVYHIRNAKITILHTLEDLFPLRPRDYRDLNDSCTVFKISFTNTDVEQELLITGDIARHSCRDLMQRYTKDTLGCYFAQMIHHGIAYGSAELYEKISPTVALWPASNHRVHNVLCQPQNQYFETTDSVQEIVLSDFGTREFMLPYQAPNGLSGLGKFTLPDSEGEISHLIRYIGPRFDCSAETPRFRLEFSVAKEVVLATTVSGHHVVEYGLLLKCDNTAWCGTEGSEIRPVKIEDFEQKLVAYDKAGGICAVERYDSYLNFSDDLHCSVVFVCHPLSLEAMEKNARVFVQPYAYLENTAGERLMYRGGMVFETMHTALQKAMNIWNPSDDPDLNAQKAYAKAILEQLNG